MIPVEVGEVEEKPIGSKEQTGVPLTVVQTSPSSQQ